jgi:hypothetical protein
MALTTLRDRQRAKLLENSEKNFSSLRANQSIQTKSTAGPGRKGLPNQRKIMGLRLDGVTYETIRKIQQDYKFENDSDVVRALIRLGKIHLDEHPEIDPIMYKL